MEQLQKLENKNPTLLEVKFLMIAEQGEKNHSLLYLINSTKKHLIVYL